MFHPKAKNGSGVVIADFLFLGVEANTLADDGRLRASTAPDGKGHFEADSQNALARFAGASAEGMSVYLDQV